MPVLVYLGIGASQGKKTNEGHGYTEIHPVLNSTFYIK